MQTRPAQRRPPTLSDKLGWTESAAAQRGRRLGKGARRDIRWALRQDPGDSVKDITLHGVKITFVDKEDTLDVRRVDSDEGARDAAGEATETKKTSAQRRSARRAKKHFAKSKEDDDDVVLSKSLADRARAAGAYPPPPAPSHAAPQGAPATTQEHPAQAGGASTNDDVDMEETPGGGRGKGEKGKAATPMHPRSGSGRGGQ